METRNKKVLSPTEGKNGKVFWTRVGNAYVNKDGSTNVWLHAYPTNGVLQIRDIEENNHYENNKNEKSNPPNSSHKRRDNRLEGRR